MVSTHFQALAATGRKAAVDLAVGLDTSLGFQCRAGFGSGMAGCYQPTGHPCWCVKQGFQAGGPERFHAIPCSVLTCCLPMENRWRSDAMSFAARTIDPYKPTNHYVAIYFCNHWQVISFGSFNSQVSCNNLQFISITTILLVDVLRLMLVAQDMWCIIFPILVDCMWTRVW